MRDGKTVEVGLTAEMSKMILSVVIDYKKSCNSLYSRHCFRYSQYLLP